MKRVSGPEGFLLAYDVVGSGNTILALHGAYSTSDELRPLAEDLAVDGMRVLLTALTEIPRFCSSKFPTLGRSAA